MVLVAHVIVNVANKQIPLHIASMHDYALVAKVLLFKNIMLNAKDRSGYFSKNEAKSTWAQEGGESTKRLQHGSLCGGYAKILIY